MKKNICKNMIVAAMFILPSCSDYLDIVPDQSFTLETIFSNRTEAYNALAKCYYYLPADTKRSSRWMLGDEWIQPMDDEEKNLNWWQPIRIMERKQSTTNPMLGFWSGTSGGSSYPRGHVLSFYEAINTCNIFISRIDMVNGMSPDEKEDWKAQAIFMKAYYHFMLLQQYGPIVIMDKATSPDDDPADLYIPRSKIDECFKYIVETMEKAIPNLLTKRAGMDLGQIDKLGATAIKARVLLYRASPFYSGNPDYYDFLDWDGEPFFPQDEAATTKAKWGDAVKAIEEALTLCKDKGVEMYHFEKRMLPDDAGDAKENPDNMQLLYDLRMVICDQWNKEMIWANSNVVSTDDDLGTDGNMFLPDASLPGYVGYTQTICARQFLGATYKVLERYYTSNGLPIDEDNSFDRNTMYDLTFTPDSITSPDEYKAMRGILQHGAQTINFYLNREMRLYANVGITGSYWRAHSIRIPTTMYASGYGGRQVTMAANNFFWSAIGPQKVVHIDSKYEDPRNAVLYPIPIIRLADLYLMKAEALNEFEGPSPAVWAAINVVRNRAGIPDVEDSYTRPVAKTPGKHTTTAGMREIIAQERKVEFALEGSIFWDMIRTRKAPEEFSTPAMGWNFGAAGADFFKLQILQSRVFTLRDCLWPIDDNELDKNSRLIQNPGW